MPQRRPSADPPPLTPDQRYIVVRGRLWRATNPNLPAADAAALRSALGGGRSAVRTAKAAGDDSALRDARRRVDEAKVGLGERGPVWWDGDSKDWNRCMVWNTPYKVWWEAREEAEAEVEEAARGGE